MGKKHLSVPDELAHLIEKRERETDRRKGASQKVRATGQPERRKSTDRRKKRRPSSDSQD